MKKVIKVSMCLLVSLLVLTFFVACNQNSQQTPSNDNEQKTITRTVKFDSMGGSEVEQQIVNNGQTATLPNEPSKTGYNFDSWCVDSSCLNKYSFESAVQADVILYAKWIAKTYTVTLVDEKGDGVANSKVSVVFGEEFSFAVPKTEGCAFVGWSYNGEMLTDSNGVSVGKWNLDKDCTAYAVYNVNSYTLQIDCSDKEAGTVGGNNGTYHFGDLVELCATTNELYNFIGWFDSKDKLVCDTEKYSFTMPSQNVTLSAKWHVKGGNLDEDGYYIIASNEDFLNFSDDEELWDKNIRLYTDIDYREMGISFAGNPNYVFGGEFDGNGHTVYLNPKASVWNIAGGDNGYERYWVGLMCGKLYGIIKELNIVLEGEIEYPQNSISSRDNSITISITPYGAAPEGYSIIAGSIDNCVLFANVTGTKSQSVEFGLQTKVINCRYSSNIKFYREANYVENNVSFDGDNVEFLKPIKTVAKPTKYDKYAEYQNIYTVGEFFSKLKSNPHGKYFIMNDLDFNNELQEGIRFFDGVIDGQGHTLKNFNYNFYYASPYDYNTKTYDEDWQNYMEKCNEYTKSLYRCVGIIGINFGIVRNVNLQIDNADSFNSSIYTIGLLCGQNFGQIERCSVKANLSLTSSEDELSIGLICANNYGIINQCCVYDSKVTFVSTTGHAGRPLRIGGLTAESGIGFRYYKNDDLYFRTYAKICNSHIKNVDFDVKTRWAGISVSPSIAYLASGIIKDILVENCDIIARESTGDFASIAFYSYSSYFIDAMKGVVARNNTRITIKSSVTTPVDIEDIGDLTAVEWDSEIWDIDDESARLRWTKQLDE